MWTGFMTKINKRMKTQVRKFTLTNQRFINFGDNKLKAKVMSLFKGSKIKREVDIKKITHITYSENSNQFVLHVPSEYDYRLRTLDRDEFILYLIGMRQKLKQEPVKMWIRPEISLEQFTKTEDMKTNVFPSSQCNEYTAQKFRDYLNKKDFQMMQNAKNTETLISRDGKKLTENDFEVIRMLGKGAFGKVILTQKKDDGDLYAIKIIEKSQLIEKDNIQSIKTERNILEQARHQFIVGLEYCFHSPARVYFAMKFM